MDLAHPSPTLLQQPDAEHHLRWQPGERLHHLFEARCDALAREGRADRVALCSEEATLTYADLDRRANRLARHLLATGDVRPGDRVALLFDKSVHSHIAMLAVLKLHAAYVPLDPGFPDDRCAFICEDAGVRRVLSVSRYAERLAALPVPGLCVDRLACDTSGERLSARELADTLPDGAGCDNPLCYVIYTSGSTGRPKGVPIEQAQICNFVRVATETYGYRPDDQVYQGLTMAFDFAVEETWVPLCVGATLHPNQSSTSLLGEDLARFLVARRITALCCVPTLLATIEADLPDLRLLIVSGEACPRDLVQRWATPTRRMLNAYGPTETTVTATLEVLDPAAPVVTIGRPLPTYTVLILAPDERRVLPLGEVGEIVIAGVGVAQGYLNRPDQTARAFIDDFIGVQPNPSGRLYRTGDLGRLRDDGRVEYLGRIDTQVKIRGYRIELSEIESVLMQQDGVRQAVVQPHAFAPGAVELVAYYTLRPGHAGVDPQMLRRRLREQLPAFMVPSCYECLAEMPMLASDKADRKSLPPPTGRLPAESAAEDDPPDGPTEQAIAATLAAVLQLDQVPAGAHFFDDLGANSLLMAGLGARLRRTLDRPALSMADLYQHPSVRLLARHLDATAARTDAASSPNTATSPSAAPHHAHRLAYLGCGVAQVLMVLAYAVAQFWPMLAGLDWLLAETDPLRAFGQAIVLGAGLWVWAVALPVVLKWILIGRWTAREFPAWGTTYLRFWAVRQLLRFNPVVLFAGSPLYSAYLRLLGARIGRRVLVATPLMPVCTDLLSIGDDSVIGRHVLLNGYRVEAGRVRTGTVTIGRGCFIGESTVVDIDTAMGDGSQLGHSSALLPGQRVAAGQRAHGSPAQPTDTDYRRVPDGAPPGRWRLALFSLAQLGWLGLVSLPLPLWALYLVSSEQGQRLEERFSLHLLGHAHPSHWDALGMVTLVGAGGLLAGAAVWALVMVTLPRWLSGLLTPGRVYPLYGPHYLLLQWITAWSNSKFHNALAGDSQYATSWLQAIGYRMPALEQTGSNFGMSQTHDVPTLCTFGSGTMVSDGLLVSNTDLSAGQFRVGHAEIGARNFIGNGVLFPAGARTGDNCLLATRTMVPIDGPLRENVGLLGSPCFEIPRSVLRDQPDARLLDPVWRADALKRKRHSNGRTMALFLAARAGGAALAAVVFYGAYVGLPLPGALSLAVGSVAALAVQVLWFIGVDRASLLGRSLEPRTDAVLDPAFWRHERFWKLGLAGDSVLMALLRGTPFMGLVWRALGVRVGRQLLDDGGSITEKTLTTLGDHATLGETALIQGHSLEDGLFKSDHIRLGDDVTLGTRAFVHYGVVAGDRVVFDTDTFLMKGEQPAPDSRWHGNPARPVTG